MKFPIALSIFSLALSFNVLAQTSTSDLQPQIQTSVMKGFFVGPAYLNVTDLKVTSGFGASTQGTSLGMAGGVLGYDRTPEQGFGFQAALQIVQSFNSAEYGATPLTFTVPEVDGTLGITRWLAVAAGLNYALWTGGNFGSVTPSGQIGGQANLLVRATSHFSVRAGYLIMMEKMSFPSDSVTFQASGFNSNIVYQF